MTLRGLWQHYPVGFSAAHNGPQFSKRAQKPGARAIRLSHGRPHGSVCFVSRLLRQAEGIISELETNLKKLKRRKE